VKGIVVPDREADFASDPVELFFDLVFVFAFSRLVYHLVHHPGWTGFGEFVLLFLMIWLPWTQFTWSTNAVPSNTRPVRLLVLVATVASVPMAGSVTAAFGEGGTTFAISLGIILAMGLLVMILGLPPGSPEQRSIIDYSIPNWIAIVIAVVGSFLDRDLRIVLWAVALAIVIAGTVRAGRSEWLIRPKHFAERHGLILIIALGEVIVALGIPVVEVLTDDENGGLPSETVASLVLAGIFACLLWWGYFDRPLPALEHRHGQHDDSRDRGRFARDVYTYLHCPLVAGVVMSAAALEEITLHPDEPLHAPFRWLLVGGVAMYLLGVAGAVYRAFGKVAIERVVSAAVVLVAVLALADADGIVLLIAVDLVILVMLAVEQYRVEVQHRSVSIRSSTR
jgi:low temperature requirement protein LtrA